MSKYQCPSCNYVGDYYDFVNDFSWDDELDDEVSVLICPKCGYDDEEKLIELDK